MGPRRREEGSDGSRDHHALYNAWSRGAWAGRSRMSSHVTSRLVLSLYFLILTQ